MSFLTTGRRQMDQAYRSTLKLNVPLSHNQYNVILSQNHLKLTMREPLHDMIKIILVAKRDFLTKIASLVLFLPFQQIAWGNSRSFD